MIEYENLQKLNKKLFTNYQEAFNRVLNSGWYILGEEVSSFEQEFASYIGTRSSVGVASGLDALILALEALELPDGSEVIVPSNTYIATILAIIKCNLTPILVEPDIATYNIDPTKIEAKITSRTGAIMVVHLYGKLCDMVSITAIANKHGLSIVEDCAQAHGASYKGKKAGSWGEFGAFSFYPTKNLGALGDGGAITCSNDMALDKLKTLRNYGSKEKYYNEVVGYNSRLDELQAALLRQKLPMLDAINAHKQLLAQQYLAGIKDSFIKPVVQEGYSDVYHIFNIRCEKRDELKEYLLNKGIKTEIHYPVAPHKQKAVQGVITGEYPLSEEIHRTTLSLPISYAHTESDIKQVITAINSF